MIKISYSGYRFRTRDLALYSVHAELPRRRRFVGGTRDHGLLWDRPALGEAFRADGRSGPAQTPTHTPYDVAPGRSLSENRWPDGLSVARRRRRGRGPRRSGPDQEEQTGGAQIDAQAAEEIWLCPRQARHR